VRWWIEGRQPFYPDGSRSFEEVDRLNIGADGVAEPHSETGGYRFFPGAPTLRFSQGVAAHQQWRSSTSTIPQAYIDQTSQH
jgi:hypothetical protein